MQAHTARTGVDAGVHEHSFANCKLWTLLELAHLEILEVLHQLQRIQSDQEVGSAFTQQELPACKPLLTPGWVISIYMLVGVIFIPIGVAALLASRSISGAQYRLLRFFEGLQLYVSEGRLPWCWSRIWSAGCLFFESPLFHCPMCPFRIHMLCLSPVLTGIFPEVVEIVDEYQTVCVPPSYTDNDQRVQFIQDVTTNKMCMRTLTVPKHMKQPIYVYYQLENFYQNHRRYVKSRSDKQLLNGDGTSLADTETCKPEQLLGDLPIVPCGLVAWSLFNDTYSFTSGGLAVNVNKKGISWKSDREHKFGNIYPENFPNNLPSNQNGSLIGGASLDPNVPLNENEDLIVWMRTAALPTFRKLYGRIERDLNAHTQLSVQISNNYNTYSFDGKKKLVLSTTSWLGGKNDFLGVAYITVGTLCIFLSLAFFLVQWKHPRPLGDTRYLSWNQKASVN